MDITSETEAYEAFANHLLVYAGNDKWDKLILKAEIYTGMTRSFESIVWQGNITDEYRKMPLDLSTSCAYLYLRDHLLNLTGDRIWGLTFTLYPDGKFEIEYDYNKPDDYEETDEVITCEEINQSLNDLFSPKS